MAPDKSTPGDLQRQVGSPVARHVASLAALACLTAACGQPDGGAPSSSAADSLHFGHPDSVLVWTAEQKLAGFRNYDRIFDTRLIPAGTRPLELPRRPRSFDALRYEVEGDTFDLRGFMEHNRVAGLLAIHDGQVVLEEYALGNTPATKWVSYSVAKSVVSLLVGAALEDGYIGSLDDPVTDYLPILRGSSYEAVTIRDALRMASGVEWNEDYTDPAADVSREIGMTALERLRYLSGKPRVAPPGERFNYNTGETNLVGSLLRAAIGNNLATYLANEIWQPFGMESDANWRLVEPGGGEHGGCCISATLRDYGRIGLFALTGGVLPDGTRVLPEGWMAEATTASLANDGYGYLWWLRDRGVYQALGIFGQAISIDPGRGLVIVTHGAWPVATGAEYAAHRQAFFDALTRALGE